MWYIITQNPYWDGPAYYIVVHAGTNDGNHEDNFTLQFTGPADAQSTLKSSLAAMANNAWSLSPALEDTDMVSVHTW